MSVIDGRFKKYEESVKAANASAPKQTEKRNAVAELFDKLLKALRLRKKQR